MITKEFGLKSKIPPGSVLEGVTAYFQPVCSLSDPPQAPSFEALGRKMIGGEPKTVWHYLDTINRQGLRPQLEMGTLNDACRLVSSLQAEKKPVEIGFISVNLHPLTLAEDRLIDEINAIIDANPGARGHIKFEILEDKFPQEDKAAIQANIARLHESGFTLYMDDLGSDDIFDQDRLKTLSAFITGIKFGKDFWGNDDEKRTELIRHYAQDHKIADMVFENVETDEQLAFVRAMSEAHPAVKIYAQGWHESLGKDASPEQTAANLRGRPPTPPPTHKPKT